MKRTLKNVTYQMSAFADALDRMAEERRHQRRLYVALAVTMAASFLVGWAIDEAFTAINAARIAGGW